MSNALTDLFTSFLGAQPVSRIRRNHGLEHATLHVLSERHPKTNLAGHSDVGGFWIVGEVETSDMRSAVEEALQRMRNGEENLAVHPNCGTNFVTAGAFAGLAGWLAMFGVGRRFRDKVERLPLAASLSTLALILAQPLGLLVQQRVTTSGVPAGLELVDVIPSRRGNLQAHRVVTKG